MAKGKFRLNSKQFFTISVLSVMVLGLIVLTGAVQQKTNTQSDASGCNRAPTIRVTNQTRLGTDFILYHLDVINNCPGYNQFKIRVKDTPPAPSGKTWTWNLNNCGTNVNEGCYIEGVLGKKEINLLVKKPSWAARGTMYSQFVIRAALRSNDTFFDETSVSFKLP